MQVLGLKVHVALRLSYQHARVLWFLGFYCLGLAWHSADWASLAATPFHDQPPIILYVFFT